MPPPYINIKEQCKFVPNDGIGIAWNCSAYQPSSLTKWCNDAGGKVTQSGQYKTCQFPTKKLCQNAREGAIDNLCIYTPKCPCPKLPPPLEQLECKKNKCFRGNYPLCTGHSGKYSIEC